MIKLSNRLKAVAELVKPDSRVADIGCDHGYIPVYLIENAIAKNAIACDINEKPLSACKTLVKQYGYEDRIQCLVSDGLDKVSGDSVDDIIIAGMGGELIADILSRCDYACTKHLILNPMTHPEIARKWLYDNGFEILNDVIVQDAKHYYCVFEAVFTGTPEKKTRTDCFLGNIRDFSKKEYFEHLLNYLSNKQKGGEDFGDVISAVNKILEG